MAYKLFYALGSAAMGAQVILEEIGAPYELIQTTIAMDEPRPPEQLALNPNGWIPILVWGEKAMYECAAITPADEPSAQRRGNRRLRETWKVINDQIGDNKWALGERFSAVDIYLFMLTTWLQTSRGHPSVVEFPNVKRIADAVLPRKSVQLVYQKWIVEQMNNN
jgi:glutathione S-transferase